MIRNYIKIAFRNLIKNRLFSAVNIIGLTAGILFTMLIGAYIWSELQVNKGLRNADRQFFLSSKWKEEGMGMPMTTLAPIGRRLKEEYPSLVANYYRWDGITSVISVGDKRFREGIQIGDSTLLSMYGFELQAGNSKMALVNPYSAIITEKQAIKFFGNTDALGKSINIQSFSGEKHDFLITGVLKKLPQNSVTNLLGDDTNGIFIPNNTARFFGRDNFEQWNNLNIPSYIELRDGAKISDLENAIQSLISKNTPDFIKANLKIEPIALTKYHLQKDNGLINKMLFALSLIGVFILVMAIINFVNISIGSSGSRTKEIGVRKAIGSVRSQLIFQFLAESLPLVMASGVFALLFYPIAKPFFNDIIGKEIPNLIEFPKITALYFGGFILLLAFLAGLYPAFILSSLKVIDSLKGKLKTTKEASLLRKSLVLFQFATALLVLIGATVITQQINYFFGKNLGYNKDWVISAQVPRDWSKRGVNKMISIRKEFEKVPQIENISLSYEIPNGNNGGQSQMYKMGTDSTKTVASQALISDENYLKTYEISLIEGNFFDGLGSDSSKIILNERAVKQLGFSNSADAVGQKIRMLTDPTVYTIKGISKDFQFGTMQQAIQPMVFFDINTAPFYRFLSFKIKADNISESLAAVQSKWTTLIPDSPFEYSFMDDTLAKIYKNEIQLKKASYTATVLAIIISLLGVIGLIALSIQRRLKEIGVRKVLGASSLNITTLFIKEFSLVFALACLLACPLAYYFMNNWLDNYANRISLTPFTFLWAVVGLMSITAILIGIQTFKSATMNPVKSLKTE